VLRGMRATPEELRALLSASFFSDAVRAGTLVDSWLLSDQETFMTRASIRDKGSWNAVVEHDPIPVVSYPFEWPLDMLLDAAKVELGLARAALSDGYITIDATPFNVQFVGTKPVHIDIGSFESYVGGNSWIAYRQFCRTFLYPILLSLYGDSSVHRQIAASSIDGIDAQKCWSRLKSRQKYNPKVGLQVLLQATADRRAIRSEDQIESELFSAGMNSTVVDRQMTTLANLLDRLNPHTERSHWITYSERAHYTEKHLQDKHEFVRSIVKRLRPDVVLDIGANDGSFSLTASPYAVYVVSIDRDDRVVNQFYISQRGKFSNILPLVVDIVDPSPGRGWLNRECAPFLQRVNPDIVLCLALLHHLVISNSIPIDSIVDMLASFGAEVILEVPAMSDPMVQILLAKKAHRLDFVQRYRTDELYRAIESRFVIRQRVEIGTRTLLHLEVLGS